MTPLKVLAALCIPVLIAMPIGVAVWIKYLGETSGPGAAWMAVVAVAMVCLPIAFGVDYITARRRSRQRTRR